ncbi:zinc finger protein ZAT5-like [Phalaenopsis equestris]|uniref:zinc finger protein ZAT5-like n=1 Tax=Phalaenopsis equestris TaxID=78828 RepID=UPI0009E36A9D|nr:zinc finger protein ZAT5-like [Phalaenopsis equestris]
MKKSTIAKGKITKRQRHHLLPPVVSSVLSPTTSAEISERPTKEEEDIADCLILLTRGGYNPEPNKMDEATTAMNITSWRFVEPATTTTNDKSGNNAHQYRDCNRCFSSRQTLGWHHASHNKTRKLSIPRLSKVMNLNSTQFTIKLLSSPATNKVKIHQCLTCGNEFNSDQALGGHMRKHSAPTTPEPSQKEDNSKRFYLDLNLPPPCNDFEDNDAREGF